MSLYRLEELFPEQIQQRLQAVPALVMPFGTIEWHSMHLPVGLDGIVAANICEKIAALCGAVLAPVSFFAVGGVPYPYTLRLADHLIEPLLVSLFEQFADMGFRVIIAFTGHFGLDQTLTLKRAALTAMSARSVIILPLAEYDLTTGAGYLGDHAGIGETSLMMAASPHLVRLDAVAPDAPLEGVIGEDPRGSASAGLGTTLLNTIAGQAAQLVIRMLEAASAAQRAAYVSALSSGVSVLEEIKRQRAILSKDLVPPITTQQYRVFSEALWRGDYAAARLAAERKLAHLSE